MDESAPMRALTIGVSVFMAIATVTAIMIYYNTAKDAAGQIGKQATDIAGNYRQDIEDTLLSGGTITGTDVINLLNYFKNNKTVKINISNIYFVQDSEGLTCTNGICSSSVNQPDGLNNADDASFQLWLKRILPNQPFNINVYVEEDTKIITLTGTYKGVNSI